MIQVQAVGSEAVREKLRQLGQRMADQALAATAVEVEEVVRQGAAKHHKQGALVGSIYKARTADGWEIGHDLQRARHALFVVFGTKPHKIQPRNKKMLRWAGPNGFIFARVVHHPGYKGDNYLKTAAQLAPQLFAAQVQKRLDRLA